MYTSVNKFIFTIKKLQNLQKITYLDDSYNRLWQKHNWKVIDVVSCEPN